MPDCLLYQSSVYHERLSPKKHRFKYGIFMLYLNLDRLPALAAASKLLTVNKAGLVSFYEADHLLTKKSDGHKPARHKSAGHKPANLADRVRTLASDHGLTEAVAEVWLLTLPRIFGYVFNPVSFYYLFGENKNPLACVIEVSNTFREMKTYVICQSIPPFRLTVPKHFYVSPFGLLDDKFDFKVGLPQDNFAIGIDTVRGEANSKILLSSLSGRAETFSDAALALNLLRYPLLTFKVIGLIHWQAFLLFLKKTPFAMKENRPELQTDVLNKHKSIRQDKTKQSARVTEENLHA